MSKRVVLLAIMILAAAHAESPWHKWARRAVTAAACAASAVDGYQSATRIDGSQFVEANPMMRNSNGSVNIGRMVSLKLGMCAAPAIMGEFSHSDSMKSSAFIGGAGSFGAFSWIDLHNRAVFHSQP